MRYSSAICKAKVWHDGTGGTERSRKIEGGEVGGRSSREKRKTYECVSKTDVAWRPGKREKDRQKMA